MTLLGIHWAPSVCANRSENNHTGKQGKRQWQHTGTRGGRDNQLGKLQVLGGLTAMKRRVVPWKEGAWSQEILGGCCQHCEWAYHFPMLRFIHVKHGPQPCLKWENSWGNSEKGLDKLTFTIVSVDFIRIAFRGRDPSPQKEQQDSSQQAIRHRKGLLLKMANKKAKNKEAE